VGTLLPYLGDSKKIVRDAALQALDKLQPGWRYEGEGLGYLAGLLTNLGKHLIEKEGTTGLQKEIPPPRLEKKRGRLATIGPERRILPNPSA
jgi:hypothetical protein